MRLSCRFLLSRPYGLKSRIICQEGSLVLKTNVIYIAWHVLIATRQSRLQGLVLKYQNSWRIVNWKSLRNESQRYLATNANEDI